MSNSALNNGANRAESHLSVSETANETPHVVLKHDRVDSPDFNWEVPGYCIPSLRYFCDNPIPHGSEYQFFGIYPNEKEAFAASQADHLLTAHGRATKAFLADVEARL